MCVCEPSCVTKVDLRCTVSQQKRCPTRPVGLTFDLFLYSHQLEHTFCTHKYNLILH